MSERAARLPEDEGRVEAFRRALHRHRHEMVDVVHRFEERWRHRGVDTLHGIGVPLRPLFIPRERLEQLSLGIFSAVRQARDRLRRWADDPKALARRLPLPEEVYRALDVRAGLDSPHFLSHFRPDGFLYRDKYVLSEINYGNGVIISIGYTEVLHDGFAHHPCFSGHAFDVANIERPFLQWIEMLDEVIERRRPGHVVLLAHSEELPYVVDDTPRVRHQFEQAQARLRARGLTVTVASEDAVWTDARGRTRVKGARQPVDLVVVVTIGSTFLDRPASLRGKAKWLTRPFVGQTPIVKPLVGLAFDKGALPWMLDEGLFPVRFPGGFRVEAADTRYFTEADVPWIVKDQRRLVMKRAFDGKHTVIGVATEPDYWHSVAALAAAGQDYVVQAYSPLPRTEMPVLIDGRVEWLTVRVELTPFIVRGRFAGALARYAPDEPGLVLSPPPEHMGMTLAYAC